METFAVLCVTSRPDDLPQVMTDAFGLAQDRGPKLKLTLAGQDAPAELFHASDLLVCLGVDSAAPSIICRAQALGLPVLAAEGGSAAELIESGRSGFLVPSGAVPMADAISWLARRGPVRERLRSGGLLAAGARLALPA